jgi:hypothetical protein
MLSHLKYRAGLLVTAVVVIATVAPGFLRGG